MKFITFIIIIFLCSLSCHARDLPEDSIYHIDSTWIDQNNNFVKIESLGGKIQIIAFVYTYCEHSCPIIMERLKQIDKSISSENKNEIHFSLYSLDPKRDTPENLKIFEQKHELNAKHWSFYNGDPDQVLELAALLGVRYKPMNNSKNDIAHSNMITVLDQQGRIAHQVKGFGEDLSSVLKNINDLISVGQNSPQ